MTLASTLYDLGQGKRDLTLSYSGGASAQGPDPLGLGPHWTFNIGTEHPSTSAIRGHKTTDITTGDGHSFTMESDLNTRERPSGIPYGISWAMCLLAASPATGPLRWPPVSENIYSMVMKTGKRARDGQRVWFYYDQNGHKDVTRHLVYVCAHPLTDADVKGSVNACADDGVWLTYSGDDVTVHGQQTIVLHTGILAGIRTMASMTLPPLSSPGVSDHAESGTLGFSYDDAANRPWLLSSVTYPDQGRTTFLYNNEADKSAYKSRGTACWFE